MLQIIVSIDAPCWLAQSVKEALACYLDLFGRSRVVEVNEILPQQLRLCCSDHAPAGTVEAQPAPMREASRRPPPGRPPTA